MASYPANAPLSIAHLCELEVPPPQLMAIAARAGLDSVGFRIKPSAPGGIEYPLVTPAEQAEIRALTRSTGVKVLYIELIALDERLDVPACRPFLEVGAAIGAQRVTVSGDSTDSGAVAGKLAELAELAAPYGLAIDLEFMPFRAVRSLADAEAVVIKAAHPNASILVDALHIFRSGSSLDHLARIDPKLLGTFRLCDAPAKAPPPDGLVAEARTNRLLPGNGGLPLWPLIEALPAPLAIGVEVPMATLMPGADAGTRLKTLVARTREFLRKGSTS